jgi:hypothetical protein
VADLDARDVSDRVERSGRAADERDEAQLARALLLRGGAVGRESGESGQREQGHARASTPGDRSWPSRRHARD